MKPFLLLLALLPAFFSCTNLDETLYDKETPESFLKTDRDFAAAVAGLYTHLYSLGTHGGFFSLQEINSDEVVIPLRGNDWGDEQWVMAHQHDMKPYQSGVSHAFNFLYAGVNNCNRMLAQLELWKSSGAGTPALADKYTAEVRALRALYYYWLLDSFGNVPIITDFNSNTQPATQPRAQVFAFVEQELNAVLPLLDKPADGSLAKSRMHYFAARALQAKLYLNAVVYAGTPRWDDCQAACDDILNSGRYALEGYYPDIFRPGNGSSPEHIFAVPFDAIYAQGFNLHLMTLHPASQATYNFQLPPWNGYCVLQEFYNLHEDADVRKKNFITGPQFAADGVTPVLDPYAEPDDPDGPQVHYTPDITTLVGTKRQAGVRIGKYGFEPGIGYHMNNDMPIFRCADIMLMKAEALWRKDPTNAYALDLFNHVRNRSYQPDQSLPALSAEAFLAERGREFFFEGMRRQDLIRFGVFGKPTQFMPGSQPCKELWPIPVSQLVGGANIQQNPCY